jgi:D-alanyl-D-alanine carboxypeptidase
MSKINPRWFAIAIMGLVSCLFLATCTLDIESPVSVPEATWDSNQNTHGAGALFQGLLDKYVSKGMPGVVLYVQTSQGIWNGAAGYAKIETSTRMLPTHLHHAASVTKVYTAAAVMLLVEDGDIELDAKISRYLPEKVYSRIPNGSTATVRQLLDHTSGIPDFGGVLRYDLDFYNDPMGEYSLDKLLEYLHGQSPAGPAGTVYFYSNANYLLLALIMDYVAGSHAKIISERILQPLGLRATYYKNEAGYPKPPGLVNSYQDLAGDGRIMNVSDIAADISGFMGNAGLIASSADFAGFIQGLLGGRVVDSESLAIMRDFGCGLDIFETDYGNGIGHCGSDFGSLIQVCSFPDRNATIVVLMNAGESGNLGDLFWNLWDEVLNAALGAKREYVEVQKKKAGNADDTENKDKRG